MERKSFLLRLDPAVYVAVERWAHQELRSVNGQIEFLLKQAVLARDLNRCIALGGNIYFLAKIGATDGKSFQQMAGSMTGMSEAAYRDMMIGGGRSIEGNRYIGEKK